MDKREREHNDLVFKIGNAPQLIGLDGMMLSASSVNLWNYEGRKVAEIDNLFIDQNCGLIIDEVKLGHGYKNRAVEQLKRERQVLYEYHISLMMGLHNVQKMLYVHGKQLNVEEIK